MIKSSQFDFDQTLLRSSSCNDDKSYQTRVIKDQHSGDNLSSNIRRTLERSSSTVELSSKWHRSYLPVSSKSLPALLSSIWSHLLQQRNIFSDVKEIYFIQIYLILYIETYYISFQSIFHRHSFIFY